MDYLYDGTFEGLLTCIYYNYKFKEASGIYEKNSYQQSLVQESEYIETNTQYADIVYNAIKEKISQEALVIIYYSYLSYIFNKENYILNFVKFAFKKGKIAIDMYTNDNVLPIREMYTKVSRESHSFLGLLRFSDIGGILYARYNPDNNVTPIIVEHFADRYKYEKFIIHDEKRKIAAIYANNLWEIIDASNINISELSKDEIKLQQLWKHYFTTHAIEARTNTNLQFQKVPTRYRKNIIEFIKLEDI